MPNPWIQLDPSTIVNAAIGTLIASAVTALIVFGWRWWRSTWFTAAEHYLLVAAIKASGRVFTSPVGDSITIPADSITNQPEQSELLLALHNLIDRRLFELERAHPSQVYYRLTGRGRRVAERRSKRKA